MGGVEWETFPDCSPGQFLVGLLQTRLLGLCPEFPQTEGMAWSLGF